jgi:PAS domain S-box-containing protein
VLDYSTDRTGLKEKFMLARWVAYVRSHAQLGEAYHKRSLARTVTVTLLLVSLFPILMIGAINFFRSQDLLRMQANDQLDSIVAFESKEIRQLIRDRNRLLDRLVVSQGFKDSFFDLLEYPENTPEHLTARSLIYYSIRGNPQTKIENSFDRLFILQPDGKVMLTTDEGWIIESFGGYLVSDPNILQFVGESKTRLLLSPFPGYTNKIILISSRPLYSEHGEHLATLIATTSADDFFKILDEASSFLPGSSSYYFTSSAALFIGNEAGLFQQANPAAALLDDLKTLAAGNQNQRIITRAVDSSGTPALLVAEWIPEYNIGIITTISEHLVFRINNVLDRFNLVVLAVSLIVCSGLVYFTSKRWVSPLVEMAQTAESFSRGNWEARLNVNRKDEIGQLAVSFNRMAGELSALYQSLEAVVEKRTSQLRIAAEVAQLATSTTQLSATLARTVELIAERFGVYNVAIYMTGSTGTSLVLREASGASWDALKEHGDIIDINMNNLAGWVASYNQARVIADTHEDPAYRAHPLLPDTRSQLVVPIAVGGEVLGVMDIQSTEINFFETESISIFQTLANQISSTLQISRLLESTQVSYQETSLLYRATRQITQAKNELEIVEQITDAFMQIPFVGSVLSVEGDSFKIQVVTDSTSGRIEKGLYSLNIPVGNLASMLTENRVMLIDDINQPTEYENLLSFLLRRGCKSAALISVLENGRLSKVLALGSREANAFNQTGLQPYANMAEVIGASLEKQRVLATLQHHLAELQILATFSQAISVETDLSNLYRVLHEQVIQTLGSDLDFLVALYDENTQLIKFPYLYDNGQAIEVDPIPLGEGLTSVIIQERRPILLPNSQAIHGSQVKVIGRPAKSWMGVPLIFGGQIIGAIVIQDLESENRFNQDDLNLFMTLAPQIATAVRNTQLYTETQQALTAYDQERFLLNTLLDNIPERIGFKDPHGRYIRVSNSWAENFNYPLEKIIGRTDYDLIDREAAELLFREEQKIMNLGKPETAVVHQMATQQGSQNWLQTSRLPIRTASGNPFGLLVIQHDITDLKLAEELAQRRADQVRTASEIARDTTGTLDVDELLEKAVNRVRDRFGFYHASIFMIDAAGEYAVLRESTGEAGRKMIESGHRLATGSKSIVGQVASSGQALIVNDVTNEPTHLPNPLLPETRGELAIPLKIGERVLGVLDVQSTHAGAFSTEDVDVLQILADQLAMAVVNGIQYSQTQEMLSRHRLLRQISTAAGATSNLEDALLNVVRDLLTAHLSDRAAILLLNQEGKLQVHVSAGYASAKHLEMRISVGQGITGQAALEKVSIRVDDTRSDPRYIVADPDTRSELAIPILFSDELIGVLNLESSCAAAFDESDQEILGALGNNLGGIIANFRLVNQVRQQVIRERQLFDVTSKIRHSVDLETILQTSTKEICRALGARRARIQLTVSGAVPGEVLHVEQAQPGLNGGIGHEVEE